MTGRTRVVALMFLLLTSVSLTAQAEMYVGGQVGWSFPNDFSNVEGTKNFSGIGLSDLKLQSNLVYGAKLGYFFDSLKWLGVETEVFNSTPHQKQQTVTVTAPGISLPADAQGSLVRVTTWAVNAIVRYPGEKFQPYAGVGMGVFSHILTAPLTPLLGLMDLQAPNIFSHNKSLLSPNTNTNVRRLNSLATLPELAQQVSKEITRLTV